MMNKEDFKVGIIYHFNSKGNTNFGSVFDFEVIEIRNTNLSFELLVKGTTKGYEFPFHLEDGHLKYCFKKYKDINGEDKNGIY